MEEADRREVQEMIDRSTTENFMRKIGDTPTDANQLIPKKYVDTLLYCGALQTGGASPYSFLPTGWTASYSPTGTCIVTHNLNITGNYVVMVTLQGFDAGSQTTFSNVKYINPNTFEVSLHTGAIAVNAPFFFILMRFNQ